MADIHRWQHQYLGATIFPKTLSAVEFRAFFTFSACARVRVPAWRFFPAAGPRPAAHAGSGWCNSSF